MAFLSVYIDHDAAHKYAEKILCCLGLGGREKYGKTYEFFKERQQQELYHCENIIFFYPTSNFLRTHGTDFFLMFISSVPNSFKYFAFRTVLYKNVIALADVFPISCQWKDVSA